MGGRDRGQAAEAIVGQSSDHAGVAGPVRVSLPLMRAFKDGDGGLDFLRSIQSVIGTGGADTIEGVNAV